MYKIVSIIIKNLISIYYSINETIEQRQKIINSQKINIEIINQKAFNLYYLILLTISIPIQIFNLYKSIILKKYFAIDTFHSPIIIFGIIILFINTMIISMLLNWSISKNYKFVGITSNEKIELNKYMFKFFLFFILILFSLLMVNYKLSNYKNINNNEVLFYLIYKIIFVSFFYSGFIFGLVYAIKKKNIETLLSFLFCYIGFIISTPYNLMFCYIILNKVI